MPTHEETQAAYLQAKQALREIMYSFEATQRQRDEAEIAMITLVTNYVGKVIESVEARTAQFQSFIDDMEGVIASMGGGGATDAIRNLTTVVETASTLVGAATGAPAARSLSRSFGLSIVAPVDSDDDLVVTRVGGAGGGRKVNVLLIHGVGNHHEDLSWQRQWADALGRSTLPWEPDAELRIRYMMYDDLFEKEDLDADDVLTAGLALLGSGIWHGVGDWWGGLWGGGGRRSLGGVSQKIRWTAGMVVQWRDNNRLRRKLRKRFEEAVLGFSGRGPDLIAAHSLGSLVSYDALIHHQRGKSAISSERVPQLNRALKNTTYVTFGSQIGNPFVRTAYAGRIEALSHLRAWYHLYNRHDDVLTARIRVYDPKFIEVDTPFDLKGVGDHAAESYLSHQDTRDAVWSKLMGADDRRATRFAGKAFEALRTTPVAERALLVGINEYPDPAMRLDGCVNDVYAMSSALQEIGFRPENIRVVLNERATAGAIRERLEWLVDGIDTRDTDKPAPRVLYLSGHGSQLPGYSPAETVDQLDECFVPYDFDWTKQRAITDDEIYELYCQLPYSAILMMIFDCCHSGGMSRDGSAKIRGVNPPDDIRHRSLKWAKTDGGGYWVPRCEGRGPSRSLAVHRLGCADIVRQKTFAKPDTWGHRGPFKPIIYQACREHQFAYEYRDGVTSYGAFTYCLVNEFRNMRASGSAPTFEELLERVKDRIKNVLGYQDQDPQIDGPTRVKSVRVPVIDAPGQKKKRKKKRRR